eukprot:SAG31_NODE_1051_length_10157_cov_203.009048_3_plen_107_part_00
MQLFEKYGTLIERNTALIEKVSALIEMLRKTGAVIVDNPAKAAEGVRCAVPGSNLGHQPPYDLISDTSGVPVLQFGPTQVNLLVSGAPADRRLPPRTVCWAASTVC